MSDKIINYEAEVKNVYPNATLWDINWSRRFWQTPYHLYKIKNGTEDISDNYFTEYLAWKEAYNRMRSS